MKSIGFTQQNLANFSSSVVASILLPRLFSEKTHVIELQEEVLHMPSITMRYLKTYLSRCMSVRALSNHITAYSKADLDMHVITLSVYIIVCINDVVLKHFIC